MQDIGYAERIRAGLRGHSGVGSRYGGDPARYAAGGGGAADCHRLCARDQQRCGRRHAVRARLPGVQPHRGLCRMAPAGDRPSGVRRPARPRGAKHPHQIQSAAPEPVCPRHQGLPADPERRQNCGLHLRRQGFHADGKAAAGIAAPQRGAL